MRSQSIPQSSIQLAPNQLLGPRQSFWIELASRSPRSVPVPLEEFHFQQQEFRRALVTCGSFVHHLLDYHLSLSDLLHLAVLSNFDQVLQLVPDDRVEAF